MASHSMQYHDASQLYGQPVAGPAHPSAYGAVANLDGQMQSMGAFGPADKGSFVKGRRRRLNVWILAAWAVIPWMLFSVLYAVLSFSVRYEEPALCWTVVIVGLILTLLIGLFAFSASGRWFANAEHEPNGLMFLFISMLLAFTAAQVLGNANFGANMKRYYDMMNLNNYNKVSPANMRGQQLMDAGIIDFAAGSKLDISKSIGFKSKDTYCVAPITLGTTPLATYDFWAVGKNCCSGGQANFHCTNFNNPHASGGLRLMADGDRAFYRLAVQQAEATYNIKAVHPLFFKWTVAPMVEVDHWKHEGRSEYLAWMLAYGVFQLFMVAVAGLAFAKLGFS